MGGRSETLSDEIRLVGVDFAYRPSDATLHGISCTLSPGEHVGVVGANGSGKST
ncbi:MAG: ATP-binding cassette domain-containing protein, partial [Ktedonobacterales bacterium]